MVESMARQNQTLADAIVDLDIGSAWCVAFGLLCGGRELAHGITPLRGCGPGWANESAPAVPSAMYASPSAVVHLRREPGAPAAGAMDGKVADKIVLSHTRE